MKTWETRLKEAVQNKRFTKEDVKEAQLWTTDPISEIKDKIELKNNDIKFGPKDIYLILDGIFFTKGVEENDVALAEACYKGIHKRVEKLYKTV
jgi:hypothetical protein